ncbi:MAG: hypothetical protein WCK89_15125 [bacterium]
MKKRVVASNVLTGVMAAGLSAGLMSFTAGCSMPSCGGKAKKEIVQMKNADFYKDGKFDKAKAQQAYFDMMTRFHMPIYAALTKNDGFFWPLDFNKGEFTAFGMAGVFWANEPDGYLGHEIFLLPGQSIPEHRHLPTKDKDGKDIPCKMESWQVRYGYVYGFSEVGEPNLDKYPEAKAMIAKVQLPYLKSLHVEKWEADGSVHKLPAKETWHFMMGGKDGAIVSEYATYHDMAGLFFTVPGAKP